MQEGRLHLAWTNRVFLQNIKSLVDTQKGSEGAEKEVCSGDLERHEPFVKRLQGKASQLSDADPVEVLHMRTAKKIVSRRPRARHHANRHRQPRKEA